MLSRLLIVVLTLGVAHRATGQGTFGGVRGIARSEAGGTPIPFVEARPVDSDVLCYFSEDASISSLHTFARGRVWRHTPTHEST